MSYVFDDSEKSMILQFANASEGMWFDPRIKEYIAFAEEGRNCASFYRVLSKIIGEKFSEDIFFEKDVIDVLRSARLWLDVAIDANGGQGAYSALIRAYTKRQGELRLRKRFTESKMQASSNQVAVNFMNILLYGSVKGDLAPWTVPSISQIAGIDASAIGEVLFLDDLGKDDTATSRNAGWSGTIGFSLLGGKPPYETWRLISAGDPGSEIKGNHELAKVNRLDDFKNILFAIDSYSVGLRAAVNNFGVNVLESLFSVVPEQIKIAMASGNTNPLIQYVVKGTPVSPIVDLILRYGVNVFFDMFKRTYDGDSNAAPTTEETFASNVYAFFSAFTPIQSQSIVTKTISEYGSATAWAKLAAQDTPVGLALRNSLKQLSEIVIEKDDGFPGRGLELYDPATGEGFITEQWIFDRAEMLARLISRTHGSFGENTLQKFSYSDIGSGKQAPMTTGVSNPLVMFGDDGGRSFGGAMNADHLYGGVGNDSISGLAGNDVIEGARGNDSLSGGDGNDALYGMAGDDVLIGGKGNDSLTGGEGNDRYAFYSGDGIDEIFDANADGQLLINDRPIPALKRSALLSNTWFTQDRSITLTLIEELTENTLNIRYGQSDLIVIKHYRPGKLGVQLPDFDGHTFSTPDLVIQGDWRAADTDPNVPGDQLSYDDLGNVVLLPNVKQRNKADALYGSPKDDILLGLGGSDRLFGQAGNDRLFGDKQSTLEKALADGVAKGKVGRGDWLDGGQGDDLLVGTASGDVLLGGNGRDTLAGGAGDDFLHGDDTTGVLEQNWKYKRHEVVLAQGVISLRTTFDKSSVKDALEGGNDVLYGQGGRDVLCGGWGEDVLDGGTEDDQLSGDGGDDTLTGGSGNDTLFGDNLDWGGGLQSGHHGNDLLEGGSGDDALAGNGGSDVLYGGPGNDALKGDDDVLNGVAGDASHFFGRDFLDGGAGDDTLWGGGADDLLFGGAGNDELVGDYYDHPIRHHGDDFLDGGMGDDTLQGLGGSDTLIGGPGADALDGDQPNLQSGGTNDDLVRGGAGNDTLWGGLGADTLYGGDDDDLMSGDYEQTPESEQGADYLDGGSGNDTLLGGGGNDTLFGGEGVDYLRGDSGNNVFDGGAGNDYLEAGDGDDIYYFGAGDGLDVVVDAGGNNVMKFGAGFFADNLKIEIIDIEIGLVLRLANGVGDAVLIKNHETWRDSTFSFSDGVVLSYQDVIKKTLAPVVVIEPPVMEVVDKADIEETEDTSEYSGIASVPVESAIDVSSEGNEAELGNGIEGVEKFLGEIQGRRSKNRQATGFTLNDQGVWVRNHIFTTDTGFITYSDLIDESIENGSLSDTPQWMNAPSGRAVYSDRQTSSASHSYFKNTKVEGAANPSNHKPQYYRSGSGSGFSFKTGDVLVEDRNKSGTIEGWYIYPAASFNSGETVRKEFRRDVKTETIKHKTVQGDAGGGRVNLEVGNTFHGGKGDDLIVAYALTPLDYGSVNDRLPGAILSAGAGNDTLLGSEGADYLISGSGIDWLYGENGADTYTVQAHAGATTIIVDVLSPVFHRPEVGVTGWKDEYGLIDQDVVILPDGARLDEMQLSWGAVLIETVNIELAPNPSRDNYRHPPRAKMLYSTLDIKWGTQQVRIVLPNAGDLQGSGIEVIRFADGTSASLKTLLESSQLGPAPDTYHNAVVIDNATPAQSIRDAQTLPLVGGHGNDLLTGSSGEDVLLGGPGNDTLSGGAGDDVYKYDGLGRDVIDNSGGGIDGIDFSDVDLNIGQLKFHREGDDLVIVVNYGVSPKMRVSNHFSAGESAIGYIRVRGEGKATQDYTATEIAERLHPLPPLRDVEDILIKNNEESSIAIAEIVKFYELNI
ncbi:calcium-binding protein [Pseudomonas fluorescens]|uniref:calcium-binding protein n=1 Tax=Pseudomonas fluorescens TaxID=294 RepID=UPI0038126622